MNAASIEIETLLKWSPAKRVQTSVGERILRKAEPTDEFWALWDTAKNDLKQAGISVSSYNGRWEVCLWKAVTVQSGIQPVIPRQFEEQRVERDVSISCPDGMQFLEYQKGGISFAVRRFEAGHQGVLIGDDQGLGKTPQAIGVVNAIEKISRVLIIAPNSVKINWSRELSRWLTKKLSIGIATSQCFPSSDIVIIHFQILTKWEEKLSFFWDLVIVDEVHNIRNNSSQMGAAVMGRPGNRKKGLAATSGIPCRRKLGLSGTPMVNRPIDLFWILHWLDPKAWPDFWSYAMRYAGGKQVSVPVFDPATRKPKRDPRTGRAVMRKAWDFKGATALDELNDRLNRTGGLMIRRLKKDVLKDLPPKRHQIIELPSDGVQTLLMEERRLETETDKKLSAMKAAVKSAEMSPEKYAQAVQSLGDVESVSFKAGAKIAHDLALKKVPLAIEFLRDALGDGNKIVLFAFHLDVIALIAKEFSGCAVVTGSVSIGKRQSEIDRFQNDPECRLFIGNDAAKEGITLTASSHVIFIEVDYVPGVMAQKADRVHRIGQKNSVLIQYLVFEGSLDVRKLKILISKGEIISKALDRPAAPAPPPAQPPIRREPVGRGQGLLFGKEIA